MKIKIKLPLLILFLIYSFVLPMAGFFYFNSRKIVTQSTLELCENLAKNIAYTSIEELILNETYDSTTASIRRIKLDGNVPGLVNMQVINRSGTIIASFQENELLQSIEKAEEIAYYKTLDRLSFTEVSIQADNKENLSYLKFTYPIFTDIENIDYKIGIINLWFNKRVIFEPLEKLQNQIIILVFFVTLVSAAVSFYLSNWISRPIELLSKGAGIIGAGQLDHRIEIESKDEIGLLAKNFNQMTDKLQSSLLEMKSLYANLEKKVEERTEQLKIATTHSEDARREAEEQRRETEALNELTKNINSVSSLIDIMSFIMYYLEMDYDFRDFWLLLFDKEKGEVYTYNFISSGQAAKSIDFFKKFRSKLEDSGVLYEAFVSQKLLYRKYEPQKEGNKVNTLIAQKASWDYFLLLPLVIYEETIGILAIHRPREYQVQTLELEKLQKFSDQIAGAVFNANLLTQAEEAKREIENQKKETEALNTLIKSLNEELDINRIMSKVHSYIKTNFEIQYYGLATVTNDKAIMKYKDSSLPEFISEEDRKKVYEFQISVKSSRGVHLLAFESKKAYYIQELGKSGFTREEFFISRVCKMESVLIIPLILQNEPIGFLDLFNSGSMNLKPDDITKLSILGEQLAGIIHGSNLFQQVKAEREKSEKLLLNILPREVAEELKTKGNVRPVYFDNISVMFTDFKGFTQIAEKMTPEDLIKELDGCFTQFDKIAERNNLEKLKTIGDSYMCAGGIPKKNKYHALDCCLAAIEIQDFMNQMKNIKEVLDIPYWELRLGIHSGPVMAGVVGEKKFTYDIWGDTVNTASRMESSGTPGKINISAATYELVKDYFECEYRGEVSAKNKGKVKMYYLNRIRPEFSSDPNGKIPNAKFFM